MNNSLDLSALNNLSPQEREYALKVLGEYANGSNKLLNELKYAEYSEIPVDIETFLTDDRYLGQAWKDAGGNLKLYDFWMERMKELFPNNIDTAYNTLLESGARGAGKSEIACGCVGTYLMYRVMCMKNPLEFFHLKPTEKICFAFLNIKLELAEEIAASKFQKTIQMSPWFMAKGKITSYHGKPWWNPPDPIQIIIGSQPDHVIGLPIFYAFADEISFIRNQDIDKQKEKAKDLISTCVGGMYTRFIHNGKNPTMLVVASSKRSEQSFMEEYIKTLSKSSPETTMIVDKPVWEVKPKGTYSDQIFYVGIGNKFLENLVIPFEDYDKLNLYRDRGYRIIEVPIDFKGKFLEDLDRGLCDFAGISTTSTNKYMSGQIVAECINETYKNPFSSDILEIGNGKEDTAQYSDFFRIENVPKELLYKPLYIHLDMSLSGDMTGIAGTWIIGKKVSTDNNQAKDLKFRLAFSVSIKAPKGRQISFEKNRNFIRWLKQQGFKIKGITCDTYQSADLLQQLSAEGFECEILSVDRVQNNVCYPYQYLRSAIYEQRFEMYRSERLFDEFIDIERDLGTGKIDHSSCFTGDTKVRLLDGRSLSFISLLEEYELGKKNYVYSINPNNNKIEPGLITNVQKTKVVNKLCKITLDNDEVITCTPEHKFMLRNGEYIEAKDLLPDDSLMPLYTKISSNGLKGYRLYYEPFEDSWHYEHRAFAQEVLDTKFLVHHKNCNKLNNNPDNLIWMSKEQHVLVHSNNNTGAYSEEANNKRKKSITEWHEKNKGTSEYIERCRKCSEGNLAYWRKDNPEFLNKSDRLQKIRREKILNYFPGIDYDSLTDSQKHSYMIKIQHLEGKHTNYTLAHEKAAPKLKECNDFTKQLKILFPKVDRIKFKEFFNIEYDSIDYKYKGAWCNRYRKKLYELVNHIVKSIEIYNCENIPVYDITVEGNHNFALDSGVFVHNCGHKDVLDAVAGSTFNASKHAEEYAYDYGESLDETYSVNRDETTVNMQQIAIDFEQEMMKILNPVQSNIIETTTNNCINNMDNPTQKNVSSDLGLGKTQPLSYVMDGIIVW